MTPEGKVKAQVKKVLAQFPNLWQHWAVQNGMGTPTLDCTGWFHGRAFAIETKAPGAKPTPRQLITIAKMEKGGARVFVIDGDCSELEEYLRYVNADIEKLPLTPYDAEPGRNQIHSRF